MVAVNNTQLEKFTRKFGKMIGSGIPLAKSLDLISRESDDQVFAKVASKLIAKLKEGIPLSSGMESFPGIFTNVYVAMVKAAEKQGRLDKGLIELADNIADGLVEAGKGESEIVETGNEKDSDPLNVMEQANSILISAFEKKAGAVFFKPEADRVILRFGDPANLERQGTLSKDEYERLLARFKIMSCLDIAERKLPQDGRILIKIKGETVDLRTQILPTVFGEQLMIFFINKKDAVVDPEKVFPDSEDRQKFQSILENFTSGLIVFSGPSGSGKTTTMLTGVAMLNNGSRSIIAVEKETYYTFEGVSHIKTRPQIGLTVSAATRAALRSEPHLLVLDSLSDEATAKQAFEAAEGGTLVFTQMTARNPADVFKQFINLKVSSNLLYGGMGAVLFQVLVRKLCSDCCTEMEISQIDLDQMQLPDFKPGIYAESRGCDTCGNTGYLGRIPLYEFVIPDKKMKDTIIKGDPNEITDVIEKVQKKAFNDKLQKLAEDKTTSLFETKRIQKLLDPSI
ncbi:MAG: ATPase, T2SS/T4P/T4SS family [Candidatus Rifleibacteriota bacterium]